MKNIKYLIIFCVATMFGANSCNSFLDVNPAGKVTQDKMFEDAQGYRDAMYGIYASIAKENLYGKNLSYGFIEQLAQLFYIPYTTDANQEIEKAVKYQYKDQALLPLIESIWSNSYTCISYVNNVLEHIEEVNLKAEKDYHFIKGEAYALRAFLHFDLMRLYCDDIQRNPTAGGIPYAYTFDLKNKKLFTLKESYENVLRDLGMAQALLSNDTLLNLGGTEAKYQTNRYSHVNLYAVYAIKARVFLNAGQADSAKIYAEKVIHAKYFQLAKAVGELDKVKKYPGDNELIWGVFNNQLYTTLYDLFLSDGRMTYKQVRIRKDVDKIYKDVTWNADNHDYRYDKFFGNDADGPIFTKLLKVNVSDPKDVETQKKATTGICLFRLPEMYYIAAEAAYAKDPTLALQYFNAVRKSRGLNNAMDNSRVDTWEKFKVELLNERRKEMWGEGQVFLDYKRMNCSFKDITSKEDIEPSAAIFILPWPRNEVEFGTTNLK